MAQAEMSRTHTSTQRIFSALNNRELWLAAFGTACSLITWFPGRAGVARNFSLSEYAYIEDLLAVAFLALMALAWAKKPRMRVSHNKFAVLAIVFASCLVFAVQFLPLPAAVVPSANFGAAINTLYKLLSTTLLLLWVERISNYDARSLTLVMGFGCLCLAAIQLLLIAIQSQISQIIFALLPLIILIALAFYKKSISAKPAETQLDDSVSKKEPRNPIPSILFICLGVFCCALICSSIQTYVSRNNTVLLGDVLFGYFNVAGAALAGLVLIALTEARRQRSRTRDILLLIPSILTLSYLLTIVMPPDWICLAFVPLAIARSMIIVFWLLTALAFPGRFLPVASLALAAYRAAQMAGITPLVLGTMTYASTEYNLVVIFELVMAIAVCPMAAQLCLSKPNDPKRDNGPADVAKPSENSAAATTLTHDDVLQCIAQQYDLSKREFDVFALLSAGWRAAGIAEKLVLSTATVKNHMNRIYRKLDVHSQDELLSLVEQKEEELRKERHL